MMDDGYCILVGYCVTDRVSPVFRGVTRVLDDLGVSACCLADGRDCEIIR